MIELILAEDIEDGTIAKSGDTIFLKDDGTFEIKKNDKPFESDSTHVDDKLEGDKLEDIEKEFADYSNFDDCVSKNKDKSDPEAYCGSIKNKVEKIYDPRIEKYLSINKEKSWLLLTKFYNDGHLDSYQILKDFMNKVATCPDITDKFEKVMDGWMRDGEADISSIEKIIDACKKEDGNVVKSDDKIKTKFDNLISKRKDDKITIKKDNIKKVSKMTKKLKRGKKTNKR